MPHVEHKLKINTSIATFYRAIPNLNTIYNKPNDELQVYKGMAYVNDPFTFSFQPGAVKINRATKTNRYHTIGFRVIRQLPKNVLKELE